MTFKKILITEDYEAIRDSLISHLSAYFSSVKFIEAENCKEFIEKFNLEEPEIILVDIVLPDISGIDAVRKVSLQDTKVIFMSNINDSSVIYKCYKAGGHAFIDKALVHVESLKAIKTVSEGKLYFPFEIRDDDLYKTNLNKLHGFEFDIIKNRLTRTELILFEKLGEGSTKRRIVDEQFISPKTFEKHIRNIKEKLELDNTNELIGLATNHKVYSSHIR